MADKAVPGMEFASWTSLPPGPISDALSKLKGPLLGMALQGLGVGVDSAPSEGVPPPTTDMAPTAPVAPIAPVMPQTAVGPVMPQLQTPTAQPSGFDQAREALRQQIKQSLGIK